MTGFGVALPARGVGINRRTSDGIEVYTVKMVAILVALKWMEITFQEKTVICSNSASVLVSITSSHSDSSQDILYEVLQLLTKIHNKGDQITFLWVPAHVGVGGNKNGDQLVKEALKKDRVLKLKRRGVLTRLRLGHCSLNNTLKLCRAA